MSCASHVRADTTASRVGRGSTRPARTRASHCNRPAPSPAGNGKAPWPSESACLAPPLPQVRSEIASIRSPSRVTTSSARSGPWSR
eukprot:6021357-Alexandrium_andersonii.AAC.1